MPYQNIVICSFLRGAQRSLGNRHDSDRIETHLELFPHFFLPPNTEAMDLAVFWTRPPTSAVI